MSMKAQKLSQAFALAIGMHACHIAGTCKEDNECPSGTSCYVGDKGKPGDKGVCRKEASPLSPSSCAVGIEGSCPAGAYCEGGNGADGGGRCQPLLPPQPLLTGAAFSSNCASIFVSGVCGIQAPASYASGLGTIPTLCPGGTEGNELGFGCALGPAQFIPGQHMAQWEVEDSMGGKSSSSAYFFETTLAMFPLVCAAPKAELGRDAMVGRQPLASGIMGEVHPLGGCWGEEGAGARGSIAAGYEHTCALQVGETVRCWRDNEHGQTKVPEALGGVVAVAAGGWHTCVLRGDSSVVCWGNNSHDQKNVPGGLEGVVAIAAGTLHNCALQSGGSVSCWGWNDDGQANVPAGLEGVVAIAAGGAHSCVLQGGGGVFCWGLNEDGQTDIPEGLERVVAIAAGEAHTCALQDGGTVRCWGRNSRGQANTGTGAAVQAVGQLKIEVAGVLH